MHEKNHKHDIAPWRHKLHEVIFEADTPTGKWFDIILIISIILSVVVVMLDSIQVVKIENAELLFAAEWFFTILFTIEYILRLLSVSRPLHYAKSFFGIIDLLAILPTYISLFYPGGQYLVVIRLLRILRIFRVLKLVQYVGESKILIQALKGSRRKITIFIFTVLTIVTILGSLMYLIEGEENGFTSIPQSIYWAIVTLTTVGYGDITPQTVPGQFLAVIIMILGYGIIAVPTGIMTVEMNKAFKQKGGIRACINCGADNHDEDAVYCKYCGKSL
ncbi:MAG TPA: ion transporter [Ignavibacteria bacterium]|nr:ion transporter [Ignavibacteria bacterium]HQY52247.1 ion transporter [Ignavibacteria bacterium]HRA98795.1 ion transporter [Ignavibacteria bacterium]